MSQLDNVPVFCVVDGKEVPQERKKKRSITCSDECKKKRDNYLRARKEEKFCKYCHQPATLAQREDFRLWKLERNAQRRAAAKAAKVNEENRE